jgi:hypothetical protein
MSATARQGLTLHIGQLVIDGVAMSPAQAAQLRGALNAELTTLLQRHARLGAGGGAVPALVAPTVQLSTPVRPLEMGRAIARSVYAALGKSP